MLHPEDIVDRVQDRLVHEARWQVSSCLTSIVIWAFVGLILLMILGLVAYKIWAGGYLESTASGPRGARQAAGATWDGQSPLLCKGNDRMTVRGVRAALPGQRAVVAQANCQLTLVDVTIEAKEAIVSQGNAKVVVQGGALRGDLKAQGLSSITVEGGASHEGQRHHSRAARITVR